MTALVRFGDRLLSLVLPVDRSKTQRRDLAQQARQRLDRYRRTATADASGPAVMDLLWAEALIQQALALETRDRLGDRHATPSRIVAHTMPLGSL